MLIIYGITALAQIALRKRYDAAGTELPIRMWLFPGLSYATVGIIVVLLAAMTVRPQSRLELVSSLICTAVALAAFFLTRRRKP
jgi:L-asparagine transporter-like permease